MAYNANYPQFYPPTYQTPPQVNRQPSVSVAYVQGENAAKAYPVQPGQTMYLFDTENPVMYVKTTDQNGYPALRIFDYKERIQNEKETVPPPTETKPDYISREEFDKFRNEIRDEIRRRRKPDEPIKEQKNA